MENNNENCCCKILDFSDEFYEKYKNHSGKLAIGISIMAFVGAFLVPHFAIAGAIVIGMTNVSVFFSTIMNEKIIAKNKILEIKNENLQDDNISLRRQTYVFPTVSPKSDASTETYYEPIVNINTLLNREPISAFK